MMEATRPAAPHGPVSSRGEGKIVTLLDALTAYLQQRKYTPNICTQYRRGAQHFLRWRGLDCTEALLFGEDDISSFVTGHLTRCDCPRPRGDSRAHIRAALRHLSLVAQRDGAFIVSGVPRAVTPIEEWLAWFDEHLRSVRGLATVTRAHQVRYVREFLTATFGAATLDLHALTVPILVGFVSAKAGTGKRRAARYAATAIRGFLRFLVLRGICEPGLVAAVPTVPDWRARFLPKGLQDFEVTRLLDAFGTNTPIGRRDLAMLLCLTRLGLRAGEVAQLTLDDLDWHNGTLRLATPKERRTCLLPIPVDVGDAIVAYLGDGRPASSDRHVFLVHKTPVGRAMSASAVCRVVRRAFHRAGFAGAGHGTHVLRHTLAGNMVQAGATLKEVADVLRHRHIDTTAVYTKVDLTTLRAVVLPWSEVAS
ncbi:MAG: tyrosine-type recombinase/integrase [Thermoleophilia bacterium]|nr:tyrosine-type recombinase/integrase [Thermoleophilia bacterium]